MKNGLLNVCADIVYVIAIEGICPSKISKKPEHSNVMSLVCIEHPQPSTKKKI